MKKVFIGDKEVLIGNVNTLSKLISKNHHGIQVLMMLSTKNEVLKLVEVIEKSDAQKFLIVTPNDEKKALKIFFSCYKMIEAAGGVVTNEKGKVLMMFRRGKWDLPKGKVDKGETLRHAAKREVIEETGVRKIKLGEKIKFLNGKQECTYHTYLLNGRRVIKASHWYKMRASEKSKLSPQLEEDIVEVGWYSKSAIRKNLKNSFHSVEWVLNECGLT